VQKMQAHIPLLLHAAPRSILHIGVGSGGTAASASLHDLETIDIVELNPRVPVAADRFMRAVNHGVLVSEPRLNLRYGDGRTYLMATDQRYDVILSDSIHPRFAGNGARYSRDYYEICRQRLRPGGVVSQWLPLYGLPPEAFLGIVRAFVEVFPDSTLWYLHDTPNPHTILVGARDGFEFGPRTLAARLGDTAIAADLREIGIDGTSAFLANFLTGAGGLERLVRGAPIHSDDRPIVEFTAGRWHGEHFRYYYLWTWHQNFARILDVRTPWAGRAGSSDPIGERLHDYLDGLGERLP